MVHQMIAPLPHAVAVDKAIWCASGKYVQLPVASGVSVDGFEDAAKHAVSHL